MEFFKTVWVNDYIRMTLTSLLQVALAVICSGFIGYEREHSHRPAGFRTHILVAIGSTLVMATAFYIAEFYPEYKIDVSRLGAQVVSGIGFLGAGTIIREGFSVKGLTTAASLWATSCIGLAIGAGFYIGAILATVIIYIILNVFKKFSVKRIDVKEVYIGVTELNDSVVTVSETFKKFGLNLDSVEVLYTDRKKKLAGKKVLKATVFAKDDEVLNLTLESLRMNENITDVYVD